MSNCSTLHLSSQAANARETQCEIERAICPALQAGRMTKFRERRHPSPFSGACYSRDITTSARDTAAGSAARAQRRSPLKAGQDRQCCELRTHTNFRHGGGFQAMSRGSQAKAANSRKADSVRFMCYSGLLAVNPTHPSATRPDPKHKLC